MKIVTYDELCEYVLKNNKLGRYNGFYDGGFLDGRKCSILFQTKDISICHNLISPYMRFYIND